MENKHITVNEIFSGIGAQRKALERLGIDHEVVGICEIDKYAIQSYEAIFGKTYNYGDICTAERLEYADLWTYSFPCQDISVAGKQQGINQNTRSGLLYQVQRLLEVAKVEKTLPKYLLLENVKNLVGKKFKSQFDNWILYLDELGYNTYWQVLNAKNYGVPQNRERVFAISIRKDLNQSFEFPQTEELKIRLKDVLEDEVDEKFYLKDSIVSSFIDKIQYQNKDNPDVINPLKDKTPYGWHFEQAVYDSNGIARAVKAGGGSGNIPKVIQIGNYRETTSFGGNPQCGRVYDAKGISPTLNTMQGGDRQPKIIEVKQRKDIKEEEKYCEYCNKKLERKRFNGRLEDFNVFKNRKYCDRECMQRAFLKIGEHNQSWSNAHTTARKINELILHKKVCELCGSDTNLDIHHIDGNWQNNNLNNLMCLCRSCHIKYESLKNKDYNHIRIRKLTPLETWRLMGFDDEDFYKAQKSGVSNSQLYKQAGNSIVVNVLEKIFKNLL